MWPTSKCSQDCFQSFSLLYLIWRTKSNPKVATTWEISGFSMRRQSGFLTTNQYSGNISVRIGAILSVQIKSCEINFRKISKRPALILQFIQKCWPSCLFLTSHFGIILKPKVLHFEQIADLSRSHPLLLPRMSSQHHQIIKHLIYMQLLLGGSPSIGVPDVGQPG